jgi:hypothetical protein
MLSGAERGFSWDITTTRFCTFDIAILISGVSPMLCIGRLERFQPVTGQPNGWPVCAAFSNVGSDSGRTSCLLSRTMLLELTSPDAL